MGVVISIVLYFLYCFLFLWFSVCMSCHETNFPLGDINKVKVDSTVFYECSTDFIYGKLSCS